MCEHLNHIIFLIKEVIQPQVPLRLPCYDFTPVMNHKVVSALPKVKLPTSFAAHSHGVTGGVYKARGRQVIMALMGRATHVLQWPVQRVANSREEANPRKPVVVRIGVCNSTP